MKSYIEFKEIPTKTKTKKFEVISKTDGSKLGEIKWQTSYRSYALFVKSLVDIQAVDIDDDGKMSYQSQATYRDIEMKFHHTNNGVIKIQADTKIFDPNCLDEISGFIKALMAERKKSEQVL